MGKVILFCALPCFALRWAVQRIYIFIEEELLMKKLIALGAIIITASIMTFGGVGTALAETWNVLVSSHKFVVNGEAVTANALNINSNNYVKVAEFAELLDIDIAFDDSTGTVLFDKTKPFIGVRTVTATDNTKQSTDIDNLNRKENQVIEIEIQKLDADEYIVLELCDIKESDTITYDITSNGRGTLFVGFMKNKDNFGTTYFGNGDFYGEKGKIESTFTTNGFEGKYYFFVKNNGNEMMENIKGTAIIERK